MCNSNISKHFDVFQNIMQNSEKYTKVHKCHILFPPWPLTLDDICWFLGHVHFIKIPNKCFMHFFCKMMQSEPIQMMYQIDWLFSYKIKIADFQIQFTRQISHGPRTFFHGMLPSPLVYMAICMSIVGRADFWRLSNSKFLDLGPFCTCQNSGS